MLARRIAAFAGSVVLIVLSLLVPATPTRVSACGPVEPKTGDLNVDGVANNCDSTVNALDASLILQHDAGLYQMRA